ncbi:MAG: hypothetical protein LBE79_05720 [Tannerella sp.]|jgi:hypothetical protein|nr:hypothetical protein [Tannerella sp.]
MNDRKKKDNPGDKIFGYGESMTKNQDKTEKSAEVSGKTDKVTDEPIEENPATETNKSDDNKREWHGEGKPPELKDYQ